MKPFIACAALTAFFSASPVLSQGGGRGFPLQVVSATVVGEDAEFAEIVAATIGPSGVVYAVDYLNCTVSAFSPAGQMLWKVGRKGGGPGEYQLPYRLAVAPDGKVLVFDLGTNEVTTLSSEGRFLNRTALLFRITAVDDMVAGTSELLVSGYAATPGVRRHGIHRFGRNANGLAYLGSFGPLPTVRDTAILRYWGAGDITRAVNGDLLYALALPYVLYRYDPAGRQRVATHPPFRVRGTPDDVIRIERRGRETSISNTGVDVDRPATVVEVTNGMVLVSRIKSHVRYWDLYTAAGAFVASREYSAEWGAAVAFDRARSLLWMVATHDDAPVLVRLQLSGEPSRNRRSR